MGKKNFPGGIPQSSVDECEAALQQKEGNFEALAHDRLQELQPGRLNPTRIENCIHPTNPERNRLLELVNGMEVDPPSGFVPNGEAQETRS